MRIEAKIAASENKPTVAVHKFTSCDGCQLAFLNMGEALLALTQLVEIRHFAEAGSIDAVDQVDIAFVEGSRSSEDEKHRIRHIRANSRYLITIGACATSGGLQALRNFTDVDQWRSAIYASPEYIASLAQTSAISELVRVDFQLWGCPISTRQLTAVVTALLSGVARRSCFRR